MDEKFGRNYKLKSAKIIDEIFKKGFKIKQFPLVLNFLPKALDNPFKIVIAAPKKNFRKAHQRNRVKRLMTESIRTNKMSLENYLKDSQNQLALFVVYTNQQEPILADLNLTIEKLFKKLIIELENKDFKNIKHD